MPPVPPIPTRVTPVAKGALPEEIFDQHSGLQTVAAAGDFIGTGLSFAVSGAGASIEEATGLVTIPTEVALAGEPVTVTARNEGGSASSRFLVTVEAAGAETMTDAGAEAGAGWRLLRYRTQAEIDAGIYYGDPEQFQQGVARSQSNPDRIYLAQDVGPIRRSDDGGASWRICVARGMRNAYFLGCAVDPVNPDIFLVQAHNRAGARAQLQAGIWRTEDAGVSFTRVLETGAVGEPRIVADTLAPAPSSVDATGARLWYCAFAPRPLRTRDARPGDSGLWRSDDYGASWSRRCAALPLETFGNDIFCVAVSPQDPERLWMGTSAGLFCSGNGGRDWAPVPALPAGACTHVEIDPGRAGRIFVSIAGQGGYCTLDGFASDPIALFTSEVLHRAFPHPANWAVCIRLPERGNRLGRFDQAEISTDALAALDTPGAEATWTRCEVPPKPGAPAGWWREITGEPSVVRWHPTDQASAFACARGHLFRTADRIAWSFANEGVSGFNYGNGSTSTEFMFDHSDPARIVMPHADVGILATRDRFYSYEPVSGYADQALRTASTRTTCNVCALQPVPGSQRIVAAVGDYNASTLVTSPDGGASWRRVGASAGADATPIRCWSINYALSEPDYCYAGDQMSADGGETWTAMPALQALGDTMLVLAVSRRSAGAGGPALYAADHRGKPPYRTVWKSTDRGAHWSRVLTYRSGSLTGGFDGPVLRIDPRDPHCFIAAAPTGAQGGVAGSISRYDTRTGRWTHYDIWQALERIDDNYVSRIAIDWHRAAAVPGDPLILYVQLAHPGMRNVLRSLDGGARWENMSDDSTNAVGQGFEVHPLTGELFSGGEAGTRMLAPPYPTQDTVGGAPWSPPNNIALTP